MECAQSVGIDLPLKALVWEDAQRQVWLGYNDPAYLAQRHGVAQCPAVSGLSKVLAGLAEASVAPTECVVALPFDRPYKAAPGIGGVRARSKRPYG